MFGIISIMATSDAIFLDTNVLLRYFVGDEEEQFRQCKKIFEMIASGVIRSYISALVLLEVSYVLHSVYGVARNVIAKDIETILGIRNVVLVDETRFRHAFALHQKTGVKLSDCLIATQVPKGVVLVTYDRDFFKLSGLSVKSPRDIVAS